MQQAEDAAQTDTPIRPLVRQERYRREYERVKKGWHESLDIYRDVIDAHVQEDTYVLDIGCGHGDFLKDVYAQTKQTYGVDPDAEALKLNTIIQHTVVASVDALPFADNFFDVIVSAWVLEHLDHPEVAFREIYRVLKPGGVVIFLTPNAWNYNVWLIRAIPNSFHDFLTRRLYNRQEHDTYPVRYKINSIRTIERILRPIGFRQAQFIFNGDPSYISFNNQLFKFACLLETVLDLKPLQCMRVHLIGVYQK
jgi:ubiquinone/menaquinone biosynthesis C-methylase UbiE